MPKQTSFERFRRVASMAGLVLRGRRAFRNQFAQMFATWPESIREPLVEYHLAALKKTFEEWPPSQRTDNGALLSEVRNGGNMPDVPLIVLVAFGIDPSMKLIMSESYLRKMNDGKRTFYKAFPDRFQEESTVRSKMLDIRPSTLIVQTLLPRRFKTCLREHTDSYGPAPMGAVSITHNKSLKLSALAPYSVGGNHSLCLQANG